VARPPHPRSWGAAECSIRVAGSRAALTHPPVRALACQVWPASGELAARSSVVVTVNLSGPDEKELAELFKLEVGR
jgi:hypothetical protein